MIQRESGRALRATIRDCLARPDFEEAFGGVLHRVAPGRLLRPLMSLIRSDEDATKHRAVSALGMVTCAIAETDVESAREVVRRLMLSLTEESGGIGWGAPDAIGEILTRHAELASEFASILLSYAREEDDSNYLEHEPLQRGVLWGLGRLAELRPELLLQHDALRVLPPYLLSEDAVLRALAARVMALLGGPHGPCPPWEAALNDSAEATLHLAGHPQCRAVCDWARL